ncbi:vomeronasal type-1 receptor 94-like [Rhinatrema bivittatum]|uniref:vomeronasal type-1 receptor 94-like n=1 Tax=Rhinatrema bivittatum TaxID=194408 RepID=UPI00112C879F|nr:vomeronasal type-1 receptor 94-like [Rhinatrema bivittatum]
MILKSPDPASIVIYFLALFGTTGNLIVLFAFVSNAIRYKVLQPVDSIIVNMALVNFLLCCYKEIPGLLLIFRARVFGVVGCRILLYIYHTLRLVSIWSVQNLSFIHLIKIRRPGYQWSRFIHRHQGQYVNWTIAGCWIFSIIFHIPYLLYDNMPDTYNQTITYLTSTNCLATSDNIFIIFTTYASVSLDFILIILVIVLNVFIIDLICKHRRQVRGVLSTYSGHNKNTAQATKVLLSLLSIYVVCWISSDVVWVAIVGGFMQNRTENNFLNAAYGILSSVYYSVSSYIIMFGYRNVKDYFSESCWCSKSKRTTIVQNMK